MTYTITFKGAKAVRDKIQDKINKTEDDSSLVGLYTKLEIWQEITEALCPGHRFESDNGKTLEEDLGPEEVILTCRVCGAECNTHYGGRFDWNPPDWYVGCETCSHLGIEGGDSVPYGSTTARLPEYTICYYGEDFDEDAYEEVYPITDKQLQEGGKDCPFWEHRV